MSEQSIARAEHEIAHGVYLAEHGAEEMWGWGTPAGRVRAKRRAALISEAAGLRPGTTALEIGCGTGEFTAHFAATGCSITAVDISAALLEQAAARGLPPGRVRFVRDRFENRALDGPYDAVIGSSVLHHLELDLALERIRELVKPGGIISFAEPNLLNPQVFAERRFRSLFPYVSPDETAFVRWTLARHLVRAGFTHIAVVPFDWLHPAVSQRWIDLVSRVGTIAERVPLLKECAGSLHINARRAR